MFSDAFYIHTSLIVCSWVCVCLCVQIRGVVDESEEKYLEQIKSTEKILNKALKEVEDPKNLTSKWQDFMEPSVSPTVSQINESG